MDFFDDNNKKPSAGDIFGFEDGDNSSPITGNQAPAKAVRNKKGMALKITVAVILAILFFFFGFLVSNASIGDDIRALKWAINMTEKYGLYSDLSREDIINAAGDGFTSGLIDQYSDFLTPSEYATYTSNSSGNQKNFGISIMQGTLKVTDDISGIFISTIQGGSSAETWGLTVMSKITAIDEKENPTLAEICNTLSGKNKTGDTVTIKAKTIVPNGAVLEYGLEYAYTLTRMEGDNDYFGMTFIQGTIQSNKEISGIFVSRILGNSPAEKAGISLYDKFYKVRINGVVTDIEKENKTIEDILGYVAQSDTDKVEFLFKKITFDNNAKKLIEEVYKDNNNNDRYIEVERKAYSQKYLTYMDYKENGIGDESKFNPDYFDDDFELPYGTAYIKFSNFLGNVAEEFDLAIKKYRENCNENLILDLRSNGGGNVAILGEIAGHFANKPNETGNIPVMLAKNRDGKETKFMTTYNSNAKNNVFKKIIILINGGSASASEALIGFLMDYYGYNNGDQTIVLVGTPTYGKDLVQTTYSNPFSGYALTVTTNRYFDPNGNFISNYPKDAKGIPEKIGYKPTAPENLVPSSLTNFPYKFSGDEELKRAIEIINALS